MVTNLSAFPSSLTVIPVPEGDVKKYREDFFVNENLKRLGCSGRVGLTLAQPSTATQAKFHQLYRTSDKIPLYGAVIELVKLCQVSLMLFGILGPEYADGLLCDLTEKAINDWWVEFGTDHYNIEPHDGILGPTTVAALLGMLMGARNRLHACGAPVSKDVFDLESTKRAISHFQKSQRLPRTRRLDRNTWEKLQRVTAKAASGEGWNVPKAVKSRVAELGGKGGEMVMETFGVREKAGISEIETVDIERFIQLAKGDRAKWLWLGKPRKHSSGDMFTRLPGEDGSISQKDDSTSLPWSGRRKEHVPTDGNGIRKRDTFEDAEKPTVEEEEVDDRDNTTYHIRKRSTLKGIDEAGRRGFGRIKDAVGRRGHHSKPSRDDQYLGGHFHSRHSSQNAIPRPQSPPRSPGELRGVREEASKISTQDLDLLSEDPVSELPTFTKVISQTRIESDTSLNRTLEFEAADQVDIDTRLQGVIGSKTSTAPSTAPSIIEPSIAGSIYRGIDLDDLLPSSELPNKDIGSLLRRTQSTSCLQTSPVRSRPDSWWPRTLSFSIAEESVLTWQSINWASDNDPSLVTDPKRHLARELFIAEETRNIRAKLAGLSFDLTRRATNAVRTVSIIEKRAELDQHELDNLYYPSLEAFHGLQEMAHENIEAETTRLRDKLREIEAAGARLEYEINSLRGKVEDVEDGVGELERQVGYVEDRVRELESESGASSSWTSRLFGVLFGIGPRIIAETDSDVQEGTEKL